MYRARALRHRHFSVSPSNLYISKPLYSKSAETLNTRKYSMKTEQEWRAVLLPQQFRVLRQLGTEAPFTGDYVKTPAGPGEYLCVGCDQPLYKANTKFPAHCGWPAFYEAIPGSIRTIEDLLMGMTRTEMRCSKCDGHLGHIFKGEGYKTPTDERHCVNSICLKLKE